MYLRAAGHWPSGNRRFYFGKRGAKAVPMPDLPSDHPDFIRRHADLLEGIGHKPAPGPRHQSGSIGQGVRAFLASDDYMTRAASTRAAWRRQLEDMEARYGRGARATLRAQHIRQDLARLAPIPAKHRRTVWRALCGWWLHAGLTDHDPAREVRAPRRVASDGHKPWTLEDVAAFRAHWPVGTAQRLAFEVLHRTCAATGDAVQLGRGNVADGWLTYERQKSGSVATCPWTAPAPAWMEASDDLHRCLAAAPKHMTFLVTAFGAARSPKAAGQWFASAARAAGIEAGKSAHGLRKHRAARMKEMGASADQRMAILGHETQIEAGRYSRSADLRRTIEGTQLHNSPESVAQLGPQVVDLKGRA